MTTASGESASVAEGKPGPPAFEFDGVWPFTGTPTVNGHPLATVTAWDVHAEDGAIPVVTLTLAGPDVLRLILGGHAARVAVSDETRQALESLGWTPPAR